MISRITPEDVVTTYKKGTTWSAALGRKFEVELEHDEFNDYH